ncbi:MAG: 7-carboxy-7-deazaguanine synthase QueE, partial [Microcoleus sp. SIO2G3]|nr:7-carboxy-7-deazaguanine synthase QueE [Microcoleus sp. SIO2G3]
MTHLIPSPETLSLPQTNSPLLPVVETFHSVQGEGSWSGTSAFFIRLAGCDVGCVWCDTKHSWNARRHPQRPIANLVAEAKAAKPAIV